jgi:hypothetical protein
MLERMTAGRQNERTRRGREGGQHKTQKQTFQRSVKRVHHKRATTTTEIPENSKGATTKRKCPTKGVR